MKLAYIFSRQQKADESQAEFDTDETIHWLTENLTSLGHTVRGFDASVPLVQLATELTAYAPELALNTSESGPGRSREAYVPCLLEQLGIPFTGGDAYVCTVTLDKQLTKLVVAQAGVPVVASALVRPGDAGQLYRGNFPAIVKPNSEGSSMGVTQKSVVESAAQLSQVLAETLPKFPGGMLVEQFIAGRDVVVPFIEGVARAGEASRFGVLEPCEYVYHGDNQWGIFDLAMKFRGFADLDIRVPAALDSDLRARILQQAENAVRATGVRDLARMDFRVMPNGEIFFLEMNAIPSLENGASIYRAAKLSGLNEPRDVLAAVIASALRRRADARVV